MHAHTMGGVSTGSLDFGTHAIGQECDGLAEQLLQLHGHGL